VRDLSRVNAKALAAAVRPVNLEPSKMKFEVGSMLWVDEVAGDLAWPNEPD
jgi:hypothetical protein